MELSYKELLFIEEALEHYKKFLNNAQDLCSTKKDTERFDDKWNQAQQIIRKIEKE